MSELPFHFILVFPVSGYNSRSLRVWKSNFGLGWLDLVLRFANCVRLRWMRVDAGRVHRRTSRTGILDRSRTIRLVHAFVMNGFFVARVYSVSCFALVSALLLM